MVTAYVLIKANVPAVDQIRDAITELDGVVATNIVAGDVDIITKIDVETPADVREIVTSGVLTITGVENTHTYMAME
ncbi:transcriptional regulator, AsnC family [Haladaptatus litoreus]|uniref:Transcriptional regulator, AsnC family n=1 Tax=Haladaptatus litoreus TaxID=553468 RepID=A0A1N7C3U7_9EURY|nr:Lrp/AsnC ligand binding domain-containing protein [Haladaptatus litoreus]SIR58237.1 transcriptional regulator, AsnC family [Haladaptatus litoreus]